MYIIEVIPLTILPPNVPQVLSYFFDLALNKGALVEVPIGSRKIQAMVISSSSLEEQKMSIKRSSFQLKRISRVIDETAQITSIQLNIAAWLSHHYYAPLGAALKTVLPPFFGKKKYIIEVQETRDKTQVTSQKPIFITSKAKSLIHNIFSLIKDNPKEGQVLIVTPELTALEYLKTSLKDHAPVVISSNLKQKEYFHNWQKITRGQSQLILGTRISLVVPFKNLKLIIIDDPSNEAYKSDMSPKYHAADLAMEVADLYGAKIAFVSPLASMRDYFHIQSGAYSAVNSAKKSREEINIVDLVSEIKTGNHLSLSRPLQTGIISAVNQKKSILLYSARRAYLSILICQNCGATTKCQDCDIPMRIHKTPLASKAEYMLVCYRCSAYRSLPKYCENCKSYKLRHTGLAGSQKIREDLEYVLAKNNLKADIFILDSDLTRTQEQEKEILAKIDESSQPIIIATQMILSYRYTRRFDFIGLVNADALMTSSDFRSEERFLYQIEKLLDFEPNQFIMQTYNPTGKIFTLAAKGQYAHFYQEELTDRQNLAYPPFSRLVKLMFKHKDPKKSFLAARILAEKLKMAMLQLGLNKSVTLLGPAPAFISKVNGLYSYNIILKIAPNLEKLDSILKFVPSNWLIDADPKSIV